MPISFLVAAERTYVAFLSYSKSYEFWVSELKILLIFFFLQIFYVFMSPTVYYIITCCSILKRKEKMVWQEREREVKKRRETFYKRIWEHLVFVLQKYKMKTALIFYITRKKNNNIKIVKKKKKIKKKHCYSITNKKRQKSSLHEKEKNGEFANRQKLKFTCVPTCIVSCSNRWSFLGRFT